MSRIERTSTSQYGDLVVTRKELTSSEVASTDHASDRDPSQSNQYESLPDQEEKKDESFDQESLKKAVDELKKTDEFQAKGLNAEVHATKDGLAVKLTGATGDVIRSMTAEEFMKLRELADGEKTVRGNLLDQKF